MPRPDTPPRLPLPDAALDALGLEAPVSVRRDTVTAIETPNGYAWAKTVPPPRRWINRMILPAIAALVPVPILRGNNPHRTGDDLLEQADRLRSLHAEGFPVSRVLYADREILITADGGRTLEKLVRSPDRIEGSEMTEAGVRDALRAMTRALAALHRHGTVHGRPKIRDFAWDGKRVTILDLEERPWEAMSMADAQARDIFLWLHDLCSAPFSRPLAPEAAALLSETMTDETRDSLRRLLRLLRLASWPARGMLRVLPGNRELTAGLGAYEVLREAL